MAPTIVIAFFIRFIDGFRVFDNVYALTGSGRGRLDDVAVDLHLQAFFKQGAIGQAVAASVMLFVAFFRHTLRSELACRPQESMSAHDTLRWMVFAIARFCMNFPIIVTLVTSFKSARETLHQSRPMDQRADARELPAVLTPTIA